MDINEYKDTSFGIIIKSIRRNKIPTHIGILISLSRTFII